MKELKTKILDILLAPIRKITAITRESLWFPWLAFLTVTVGGSVALLVYVFTTL